MQTKLQIQNRINELEQCLEDFPNIPERALILADKNELYQLLENEDYEIHST